ncbi:hypothetical protein PM10SUCC1_21120 [Propionigenium maris DSM 9537]|uniref:Uncharacterized protein n=1 Tax=Propionigenium maris DSM 9537 TaxID=1123000 RepID=A0A9W6LNH0_9FUSO|nr:hypothetical protein PM10SUCC1_21120 [Propionigenium maris DSM 9537]
MQRHVAFYFFENNLSKIISIKVVDRSEFKGIGRHEFYIQKRVKVPLGKCGIVDALWSRR